MDNITGKSVRKETEMVQDLEEKEGSLPQFRRSQ